jgi:hypothetical protein
MSAPDYRCPGCNAESEMVIGPTQALCTNSQGCRVLFFDPSLPDGGLSQAQVVDLPPWLSPPPDRRAGE